MHLNPQFVAPFPPHFWSKASTPEETALIRSLTDNLSGLRSYCENLVCDVALMGFCDGNPENHLREWRFLAGRDGAMALRNFKEALLSIRGLVGRCPSISDLVDTKLLREAEARFNSKFPRAEKLRHSVAHPEFYSNPNIKMSTDEPIEKPRAQLGAGVTVQGSILGRTFIATINGLTVECEDRRAKGTPLAG